MLAENEINMKICLLAMPKCPAYWQRMGAWKIRGKANADRDGGEGNGGVMSTYYILLTEQEVCMGES